MEHLLQKSKCSIFHNIFKYMIFQRRQNGLLMSKGLKYNEYTFQNQAQNITQKSPDSV